MSLPPPLQTAPIALVSHPLCPYVQRAAIALAEKGLEVPRLMIDLADKPDWFKRLSPLGKTPVLTVYGAPVFESAVILEYLEETQAPALHPDTPLARAQARGWIEVASATLADIAKLYNAPDATGYTTHRDAIRAKLQRLERAAVAEGPWFAGAAFTLVDAAFAPVFRYFEVIDPADGRAIDADLPLIGRWRRALAERPSVIGAVAPDYSETLRRFFLARDSHLAHLIA